jgi:hypothetical protein
MYTSATDAWQVMVLAGKPQVVMIYVMTSGFS